MSLKSYQHLNEITASIDNADDKLTLLMLAVISLSFIKVLQEGDSKAIVVVNLPTSQNLNLQVNFSSPKLPIDLQPANKWQFLLVNMYKSKLTFDILPFNTIRT